MSGINSDQNDKTKPDSNTQKQAQATGGWGAWWEQAKEIAQVQAKELAIKAQVLAEQATKAAQEKATALASKAQELRQNYDFDTASQAFLDTINLPPKNQQSDLSSKNKSLSGNKSPLDLIYLTENVVAMAFPVDFSKKGNQLTGNDIRAVSLFLRRRHAGHFMIWNISEESYDYSAFNDQVLEYKFPGHPAPPLGLLFKICTSVESWLDADEKNIAVAHCLTGKGRTAALLACVLTWIGEFASPVEALQYIADRRAISVDYLTIPSQRRYLQYFSNMLDGVKPRSEPLLLRRLIFSSIPNFGDNGGGESNVGCCPYIQLFKCGKLIATAAPSVNDAYSSASGQSQSLQLKWINQSESSVSFNLDCVIQGDILLRCRHADSSGAKISMFRAAFHTGYVPSGVLRLTKAQLDGTGTDSRYDDEFFIDLIFAPIEKASGTTPGTVGVPSDSGLVIDASSTDRYEMSLHRDSRFWETVSARKLRSKKRKSRKFLSNTQEQFSIGDDFGGTEDLNEIKFSNPLQTTHAIIGVDGDISYISNEELINQLAQAQDDEPTLTKSSTSNLQSNRSVGESAPESGGIGELQALKDLEKELGLDDLNLFKAPTSPAATASAVPAQQAPNDDEDNLDELEQYLQSLSSS